MHDGIMKWWQIVKSKILGILSLKLKSVKLFENSKVSLNILKTRLVLQKCCTATYIM